MPLITEALGPTSFMRGSYMDAYSSEAANYNSFSGPPVLVAASSSAAMMRAEGTIVSHGLRIGARLPIEDALARIKTQASATAVWIEIDRDCGDEMDELLFGSEDFLSRETPLCAPASQPECLYRKEKCAMLNLFLNVCSVFAPESVSP